MRAPSSKCKPPDYFFKLIPPGLNSQLSIPTSFRKYMKIVTRNNTTAILKKGCRKWPVKIIACEFGEGWEDFVRENGVQEFDIVVFKHEGNMVFDTMVFDSSLCEKEYPTDQVSESSSGTCELDNINELKKSLKGKDTNPDHDHHPFFIGNLKSARWKYSLYLPIKFTRANGLTAGEMILRNNGQTQRSWTVDLNICSVGSARIGRGWHDFYISNGLKEGDRFKLELVRTGMKPEANFYGLPKVPPVRKEGVLDPYFQKVDFPATPSSPIHTAQGPLLNPYFKSTVTAYRIKRSLVIVPVRFARSNGLFNRNCEMVLMDEKQRLWPTRLWYPDHHHHHVYIRGIRDMWVANGLKKGDDFLLELVDNGKKPQMTLHKCRHLS